MTTNLYQYARVNELVCSITDNKILQTFFILYLMADSEAHKMQLNQNFKDAWQTLPDTELDMFKQDFTNSFKKLLPLTKALHNDVLTYKSDLLQARVAA